MTKPSAILSSLGAPPRSAWMCSLLAALVAALALAAGGCGNDSPGPAGLQPGLNALSPDSGTVGTEVEITGSNFESGLVVRFGGFPASGVSVLSPTTLLAHAPDSIVAGARYEVQVINPGGKSAIIPDAFKAVGPDLQIVNGVTRPSGFSGSTIIFEGHAFGDLLGKGHVWFTDDGGQPVEAPVADAENWTNEFVVTTVPANAGSGPVWIETPTGTSRAVRFMLTEAASFSPSQIFWTPTTPLPEQSQGHKAVFLEGENEAAENVVFLTGGADGSLNPRAATWKAAVEATGGIGAWTGMGEMPDTRAFHGMVLATPYNALIDTTAAGHLYVLGGIGPNGSATSTVWRAPVYTDRTIGAWTSEPSLPAPVHSMGAVVFRSWIYVAGGAGTGNAAVASVYRARIGRDGSLGAWESQPSLPESRAYGTLLQFAGRLYMVGGDAGTVAPATATTSQTQANTIYSNPLDLRTATLKSGLWPTNPSTLIKTVAKHSALVAGGTVLVSGGIYNGAGNSATEHQYATINLDGTIDSFNGATGSQTIGGSSGAGGEPFFNHAAITYVDGSGAAHVVILGGNNVNAPSSPMNATYYY